MAHDLSHDRVLEVGELDADTGRDEFGSAGGLTHSG